MEVLAEGGDGIRGPSGRAVGTPPKRVTKWVQKSTQIGQKVTFLVFFIKSTFYNGHVSQLYFVSKIDKCEISVLGKTM